MLEILGRGGLGAVGGYVLEGDVFRWNWSVGVREVNGV